MRIRRRLIAGGAALLLTLGPSGEAAPEEARVPGRVVPSAPDHDLATVRDIFRYADVPASGGVSAGVGREAPGTAPEGGSASPPLARLVGLVERADRLAAALAIEGEVMLLAEGQVASGFTVLEVTEEAVRLRTPEGDELTLALP